MEFGNLDDVGVLKWVWRSRRCHQKQADRMLMLM